MPSPPPHEKTSEWIHIRLHKNPKNPEYETFCQWHFESYISCHETHSNRPHVHILVKKKSANSLEILDLLKKSFGIRGNTDYSIKNVAPTQEDLHEISKYVCKGSDIKTLPDVVFRSAQWTPEIIKKLHAEYWAPPEPEVQHVSIDLNQFQPPPKKIARKTWTEKIIEELDIECPDKEWDWHNLAHREWMTVYVLKKLGDKKKIFNEYKLKEFVYACFNSLDAKNFRYEITQKVMGIL